jgi:hypothetical protein
MNEHTQKLLEQATYHILGIPMVDQKKFAELIVAECIAQCWTVSELESNGYVVSECSKKIRKHFGVEE